MDPKVINLEPVKVLSVRKTGPYSKSAEEAFGELLNFVFSKKLVDKNAQMFGLSYDNPDFTQEDELRFDACIAFDGEAKLEGDVKRQVIVGGKFLMILHEGSYSKEYETYRQAFEWMGRNRLEYSDGPCIEKYLNNPHDTKPEDLRTEIYIPIK